MLHGISHFTLLYLLQKKIFNQFLSNRMEQFLEVKKGIM